MTFIKISYLPIVNPKIHDTKTIIDTIELLKIEKNIKINLIGDKGYISKKINRKKLLKDHKIKLINPTLRCKNNSTQYSNF